jgi:maltose O-acetyltransferase
VLNFLTNYIVAYMPSFALRRLWYRWVLGIEMGRHVGVFMGTYVWFQGPRVNRRNGVRIGRNTRINRRCTLDLRGGLVIGNNVSISPEVMILAASHDVNKPDFGNVAASVTIEDHAFIGTRAMILPGVTVGRGAVVNAGSQVSKDVPPMTIVAGTPARPIGVRDPGATAYELGHPLPLFE